MSRSGKYGARSEHTKFAENEGEMCISARYVKRVAVKDVDFNSGRTFTYLWLKSTVLATVQIVGKQSISGIDFWNQDTKDWVSFVLN